jgi:nitroreductase
MDVRTAILERRTVKTYAPRPIAPEVLEELLEVVVWAPNHRMTEPWRFVVLGRESRRAYGEALGRVRAGKVADADAAEAVRRKSVDAAVATPATLVFVQRVAGDPGIQEEDYAAIYMGIQNLLLAATARGLVGQVKTGAVLADSAFRSLVGAGEGERVVALVHLGEPAALPSPKPRTPASKRLRWLP